PAPAARRPRPRRGRVALSSILVLLRIKRLPAPDLFPVHRAVRGRVGRAFGARPRRGAALGPAPVPTAPAARGRAVPAAGPRSRRAREHPGALVALDQILQGADPVVVPVAQDAFHVLNPRVL